MFIEIRRMHCYVVDFRVNHQICAFKHITGLIVGVLIPDITNECVRKSVQTLEVLSSQVHQIIGNIRLYDFDVLLRYVSNTVVLDAAKGTSVSLN